MQLIYVYGLLYTLFENEKQHYQVTGCGRWKLVEDTSWIKIIKKKKTRGRRRVKCGWKFEKHFKKFLLHEK